jgi:hypothetical protein
MRSTSSAFATARALHQGWLTHAQQDALQLRRGNGTTLKYEAVELRLGQRYVPPSRAGSASPAKEGLGQWPGGITCRDGLLLHRLEQRRLRLGRGSIDLIGEDEIGEDRAGLKAQAASPIQVFADDRGADDIRGHQVGCELDATEAQRQHLPERPHQQRLAQPGHAFEQHVATRE